jgi:hypothetical protein
MVMMKRWVRGLINTIKLMIGLVVYLFFKKTPAFAYQGMVGLFCTTKGYSNDLLSWAIGLFKRPVSFINASGILGNMSEVKLREPVVSDLRKRGYHIFENRLPDELCERLLKYATSQQCKIRPIDGEQLGKPVGAIYHRGEPSAVRYDFNTQDLLNNQDIQKLLADLSFATVAQDYFGARPVIDVLSMWWHTNFSDTPDSEAAQYFHFDMDRPKWLKFFIYLTDVETTNGPHSFVVGSHKTGGIPSNLLRKGYARLTDEEVASEFDKNDVIEFNAPRGTIIAEDTRGLHKGKHVTEGDRLLLQIQFSNSLFGGFYPKAQLGSQLSDELKNNVARYPWLYAAYL